jgi:competence protein ComEA
MGLVISGYSGNTTVILAKHWLPEEEATVTVQPGTLGKININTASAELLTSLPGIGSGLAERIVEYRTKNGYFIRLEDLLNVDGLGKTKLENISKFISFSSGD